MRRSKGGLDRTKPNNMRQDIRMSTISNQIKRTTPVFQLSSRFLGRYDLDVCRWCAVYKACLSFLGQDDTDEWTKKIEYYCACGEMYPDSCALTRRAKGPPHANRSVFLRICPG